MAEELKVVTKAYDLVMWLLPQVSKFPRDYRFHLLTANARKLTRNSSCH